MFINTMISYALFYRITKKIYFDHAFVKKREYASMKRTHVFTRFFLLPALFFAGFAIQSPAEEFEFKYRAGEKYKILSEVEEKVYINGRYSHQADIMNRISVEVTDYREGMGTLEGRFITTERLKGSTSAYQIDSTYDSVYRRGPLGEYEIEEQYYMPVVRNVPVFPDKELETGDTWKKRGEEVHDLRRGYGIDEPFRIPFLAHYRYQGKGELDDKTLDLISVQYEVRHNSEAFYERYSLYPERISGFSDQTIYWDGEAGRPYAYHEQFSILFYMSNGDQYEFIGTARAKVTESIPMDKEKVAEELNKIFDKDKVDDTRARVGETGVTIDLEDIKFEANSDRLLDSEKRKLDKIAEVLSEYPDRHLEITGHTALAGTEEGRQRLSELRAQSVADYFLEEGIREPKEIITEGKGAREPVADNSTAEGMRRNRRVEITILEN